MSKPKAKFELSLMSVKQSTNIAAIERACVLHSEPLFYLYLQMALASVKVGNRGR